MRQLYGLYRPDDGVIMIDGQPAVFHSPSDAIRAGIGMIHQHFMLVPTLTVTQNVALGLQILARADHRSRTGSQPVCRSCRRLTA